MPTEELSYKLTSRFSPSGDQPTAIKNLYEGLQNNETDQVLLGITGSGKTFTMANLIAKENRPALIMAHNKTLAAQLYSEMKSFFPDNAVEYFVSYYDYYQPEAYIPRTDTFIEKDSSINEQIDRMRHSATRSLLERTDSIVVSSVSCIYGLGSPELYYQMILNVETDKEYSLNEISQRLVELQYERNDVAFERGCFRIRGDNIDVFPAHYDEKAWRLSFFGNKLESIHEFDPLTGSRGAKLNKAAIYANSHFVTPKDTIKKACGTISQELEQQIEFFRANNQLVEAQRIQQRTEFDLEMLAETGSCKGIENYSRHLTGKTSGMPPPTLFEYLPKNALLFVDESHVMVPQINGMYNGDRSRKSTLVSHGFRLPSALDNRPLKFEEWNQFRPKTIYVSATPAPYELDLCGGKYVSQIIRPTGLLDPLCEVRPAGNQVEDLVDECKAVIAAGHRVLATTLTKKMAEDLTEFMKEKGLKVAYLHSNIITLERIEIINELRNGVIDVIIGINLLREGLDIPECALMAILDADKEGFLRSETALIQTIGRAARNSEGRVILYADNITGSMKRAMDKTAQRRKLQIEYNNQHNITATTIIRSKDFSGSLKIDEEAKLAGKESDFNLDLIKNDKKYEKFVKDQKKIMHQKAANLEFEEAAAIRDHLNKYEEMRMKGI